MSEVKFNGRKYKVRSGARGGKYIMVGGEKKYINMTGGNSNRPNNMNNINYEQLVVNSSLENMMVKCVQTPTLNQIKELIKVSNRALTSNNSSSMRSKVPNFRKFTGKNALLSCIAEVSVANSNNSKNSKHKEILNRKNSSPVLKHIPAKFCISFAHEQGAQYHFSYNGDANQPFNIKGLDNNNSLKNNGTPKNSSPSSGPNGLVICNDQLLFNWFHKDLSNTRKLIDDFLDFRDRHINNLFCKFIEEEEGRACTNFKGALPLYNKVVKAIKGGKSYSECGMKVVSLCQTWMKNNEVSDVAQFSIASPHTQTLFYPSDLRKLYTVCGVTDDEVNLFLTSFDKFVSALNLMYGTGSGGPCFVDLDHVNQLLENQSGGWWS